MNKDKIKLLALCIINFLLIFYAYFNQHQDTNVLELTNHGRLLGPLSADDLEVISRLRKFYLNEPSRHEYNLTADFNTEYSSYSHRFFWKFIDHYLKEFFGNSNKGFFFEAGALDGEFMSNTLWLEKNKSWTGILVEPDSFGFKAMMSKNRKAWTSNSCISSKTYPEQIVLESFSSNSGSENLFWIIKAQTRNIEEKDNFSIDENFEAASSTNFIAIQCFPLISYFIALNVSVIDFLSLDTQGGERLALKHLFSHVSSPFIRSIAVEYVVNDKLGLIDDDFVIFMKSNNFTFVDIDPNSNYLFINSRDDSLISVYNSTSFTFMSKEEIYKAFK